VTPASIPPHPLALPGRLIIDQWIDAPQCRAGRFTVTVGDDPAAFYGWFAFP
jgi:hypothetical protein